MVDCDLMEEFRQRLADRFTPAELVDLMDIDIETLLWKFDDDDLLLDELFKAVGMKPDAVY